MGHGRYATYGGDKFETVSQFIDFFEKESEHNTEYIIFDNVDDLCLESQISLQLYLDYHRGTTGTVAQLIFTSSRAIGELRDHRERLFQVFTIVYLKL